MASRPDSDNMTSSKPAPADLVLLLVEDDIVTREMLLLKLKRLFAHVEAAQDGVQGLQLFLDHAPDIILSDQLMPGLSGLDMFRKIRAVDQNTPLILMTSYMDNDILLEAINLGVNRFIPKPFNHEVLARILTDLKQEISDKRHRDQCRLQEITALRCRDSYLSMQQEAARRKERHVARHDLRNRAISGADGIRWGITVTHVPRDIMCGDAYTIRSLPDGRQLVFIVDAMGSGLSAALSALLATSFCNYLVEHLHNRFSISLEILIKRFQEYLGGILLEEEVLSCGFFLVDLMSRKLETALCGLPPLLVRTLDGSVRRIPGTNPPLRADNDAVKITTLSLNDIADIMVMTDGITDAALSEYNTYRERLESDFRTSPTLAALLRLFRNHTVSGDQDDLTMLHLHRLDFPGVWSWRRDPLNVTQLAVTVREFLEELTGKVALKQDEQCEIAMLLDEALTNALEHGGLKSTPPEEHVVLSASLWQGAERPLLILEINDNGPGLLPDKFWNARDGCGLKKIWHHCDSVYIGGPGCRLILVKTIEGGHEYAH